MKKRLLALTLAVITALSLTACGDSAKEGKITLGEYKGLKVGQSVKDSVTDEMIQQTAELALEEFGTLVDKNDVAEKGDTVTIDYTGYVDGEAFDGGSDKGYTFVLGSANLVDGFQEGIVGHAAGETFDVEVTFPDNYYEELKGKTATFTMVLNSVKVMQLPELTDEFVEKNFGDLYPVKTVEEFYDYIEQQLIYAAIEDAIFTDLFNSCEVTEWPEEQVEELFETVKTNYSNMVYQQYGMDMATFYATLETTEAEFDEVIRDEVKSEVKRKMMIQAIADKENITYTDEEYETVALQIAETYGYNSVAEVEAAFTKEEVVANLLEQKVMEWICDHVEFYDDSDEIAGEPAGETE